MDFYKYKTGIKHRYKTAISSRCRKCGKELLNLIGETRAPGTG
jgi:hypothetical protein